LLQLLVTIRGRKSPHRVAVSVRWEGYAPPDCDRHNPTGSLTFLPAAIMLWVRVPFSRAIIKLSCESTMHLSVTETQIRRRTSYIMFFPQFSCCDTLKKDCYLLAF
jgi:hypothetical protein